MTENETNVVKSESLVPPQFTFFAVDKDGEGVPRGHLGSIFALRYEVYCKERHFLASEDYPDQQEEDIYDPYSIHLGGIHQSGQMVATSRLVLLSPHGFPLTEHCPLFPEYQYLVSQEWLDKEPTAEISRLAISKSFRRRKDDGDYGASILTDPPMHQDGSIMLRRQKPAIIVGIFRLIYQASKRRGITHWLAAMETPLLRLLHRFSLNFKPIGPEVDYYGPVTPFYTAIADIDKDLYENNPQLLDALTSGLEPELLPTILKQH